YYAAKVDGTSDMKYLLKVMIPLASPTITSITILKVMGSWNSYIWPRLVNEDKNFQLISNWLTNSFVDQELNMTNYPMKMAGVVMVSLPLIIIFIFFRKYIMKGVSKSGIKG
ncbi:MAG: ABC transporter permease subunit, partial [Anaeroplasmataceae bacterium]|nr:ABC transporter permease subunit [Anaeroplasmataceae bacterium]